MHSGNMHFGEEINSKSEKLAPRKKFALELLHQRLGHRSTRSLMAGDTTNIWNDTEPMIDPYPFCTSCQISTTNKKARSKNAWNPKAPFKWVLWILLQQHHQEVWQVKLILIVIF